MKNVIIKTRQSWKFKVMVAVLILSGVSIFYGLLNIDTLSNSTILFFMAGGTLIGMSSFIVACINIKCPNCGYKWFWSAVRDKGYIGWLYWLNRLNSCPNCGELKK